MNVSQTRPVRGRFAPSPSGRMHLGNLFSALLAWLDVRSLGGVLVLRMEDLDPDRCKREYAAQIAEDFRWLGLQWDEGWENGPSGVAYAQSSRMLYYAEAFSRLERRGLLYPCYCSRAERLAAGAPHAGEGEDSSACPCRNLTPDQRLELECRGRMPSWRITVPQETVSFQDGHYGRYSQDLSRACGDFILRRSDGVYAYQLAVTADDGLMGITRVVRGRDLLPSTPRQLWLHSLLGFEAPDYCHVPMLLAPDGRRLSKRERDLDMGALRRRFSPEELVGHLAYLAGLVTKPAYISAVELVGEFSWSKVSRADIHLTTNLYGP